MAETRDPARFREDMIDAYDASVRARGRFVWALTGGSTVAMYRALRDAPFNWSRVVVVWGDERAVPPTDPASNYRGAREALLDHVAIPDENVLRMPADESDLGAAAQRYEQQLVDVLGSNPAIDVLHMGLGPDGHVLSLFPGHKTLSEMVHRVAAVDDSPKPPPRRLTLTLRAVAEAGEAWFFAVGAEKRVILSRAWDDTDDSLPVVLAARAARHVVWYADADA